METIKSGSQFPFLHGNDPSGGGREDVSISGLNESLMMKGKVRGEFEGSESFFLQQFHHFFIEEEGNHKALAPLD